MSWFACSALAAGVRVLISNRQKRMQGKMALAFSSASSGNRLCSETTRSH